MKIKKLTLAISAVLLLALVPTAQADEATDRTTRIEQIKARWNPIFDQQYIELTSLATKAKLDTKVYKDYLYLVDDFLHVRRVIDDALASASGDIEAANAYAEEETGEFMMSIPSLATQVGKIKTITCVKGKTVKKATGITPKCPAGFKKK